MTDEKYYISEDCKHDNPADYGLTKKDAVLARRRYLNSLKKLEKKATKVLTRKDVILANIRRLNSVRKIEKKSVDGLNKHAIKSEIGSDQREFCLLMKSSALERLNKIEKDIKRERNKLKMKEGEDVKSFDIKRIKEIPLDQITQILPNGFFVNNPFRDERSPSNSLHWNKKSNRYTDFGTGLHGDVIDLFMAVNQVDLITALKELNNL